MLNMQKSCLGVCTTTFVGIKVEKNKWCTNVPKPVGTSKGPQVTALLNQPITTERSRHTLRDKKECVR